MIKLIIFDLDGTLLNSLTDIVNSCNYLLKKYNFPEYEYNQFKYFVGNGIPKLIERIIPDNLKNDQEFINILSNEFIEHYTKHQADYTAPYTNITELLTNLQNKNIALAVASNKANPVVQSLIEHYFPDIHFALSLGKRDGYPLKPDPKIVYEILQKLQIKKEETLYVGDSETDMFTANNAGVTSVGVLWGFRSEEEIRSAGAKYIVKYPDEILQLL